MRKMTTYAFAVILVATFTLASCTKTSVRERNVMKNEISFWRVVSKQSVSTVRSLMEGQCSCTEEGGELSWDNPKCDDAAELVVVLESRADYHADMMEYLGNITKERPDSEAPVIPENTSLCEQY